MPTAGRREHNNRVSKFWTTQMDNREHNNTIIGQKRMTLIPKRGKGCTAEGGSTVAQLKII